MVACVSRMPKYAGTVITTPFPGLPSFSVASSCRCLRINAEMLSGVCSILWILKVRVSPMLRLTSEITFSGSAIAAFLATSPTTTSVGSWK